MKKIPMMPRANIGKMFGFNKLNNTSSREWTKEEIEWIKKLRDEKYSITDIARSVDRTYNSVAIKLKRLAKKTVNKYNKAHRKEKYSANKRFLDLINPKSVLDLYSGAISYYLGKAELLVTNDINKEYECSYNEDAPKCLAMLWYYDNKYDLVDLDPFGSAFDCFDLAIQVAQKGLIITFGEMGNRRFGRLDFVNPRYGICSGDNWIEKMIMYVQDRGVIYKKKLIPVYTFNWNNISRTYFKIEKYETYKTQKRKKLVLVAGKYKYKTSVN